MHLLTLAKSLSNEEIALKLQQLRQNALVESSHFAVSALIEIELPNGMHAYVGGVNVENEENNRLGLHAEQNAIASAQTLFLGNIKFKKIWVMGAPDSIQPGSEHSLANNPVTPCGHCRQILSSCSHDEAMVQSVTINGKISELPGLDKLLIHSFSEKDLNITVNTESEQTFNSDSNKLHNKPFYPADILNESNLSSNDIAKYLKAIKPHIVDDQFKTSPIVSCILKVKVDGKLYYMPGSLVQDVAFLTTDPIFVALGMAVTQFKANEISLEAVYLYGDNARSEQLSSAELHSLTRFAQKNIPVHCYTQKGLCEKSTLSDVLSRKENIRQSRLVEKKEEKLTPSFNF